MKGQKNLRGDYIVTTIDIPDIRKLKGEEAKESEESSDSDSDYGNEDESKE
jgi:hypothetical protein